MTSCLFSRWLIAKSSPLSQRKMSFISPSKFYTSVILYRVCQAEEGVSRLEIPQPLQ